MKQKKKEFDQHLFHDIENDDKAQDYLDSILPLIGLVVMYFNGLENSLDKKICEIFTERTDSTGLIVLHKMSYSTKVDLYKRFCDDIHFNCEIQIDCYHKLINDLIECGRLRNLVVHADWENTDDEGYTYVNLKITKNGMKQEYIQFTEKSLEDIIDLILKTEALLYEYWTKQIDLIDKSIN